MFFVSIDQSDIDLRHALANLVGVVLGSPTSSNHLWYHLFAADKLENTYMTGFMVSQCELSVCTIQKRWTPKYIHIYHSTYKLGLPN